MTSRALLRTYEGVFVSNSTQGEMSSRPPNGCWNSEEDGLASAPRGSGRGGGGSDGCGCRSTDASWSARFPPAESPAMMMLDGDMPLSSRCRTAAVAWRSWVGKGYSGARAMFEWLRGASSTSRLSRERTVVEKGDSDGTLAILLKGREHLEMVLPSWKNKSPTLRPHRRPRSD